MQKIKNILRETKNAFDELINRLQTKNQWPWRHANRHFPNWKGKKEKEKGKKGKLEHPRIVWQFKKAYFV